MTSSDTKTPIALAAGFPAADDAAWRTLVDKALKGADVERLISRTADDIEIAPLYTADNSPAAEPPRLQLARGWRITQIRSETTAQTLAAAITADIEGGADAVTIRLAAPGQTGLPGDHKSMEAALAPLPLERIRIALAPGAAGIAAAHALVSIATKRGAQGSITGLGIDPLGTLALTGDGSLLHPDGSRFTTSFPWLTTGTTLLADARPYHEGGASEAQELAALLSTLVAYLRWCEADGIAPDRALPRIALAMAVDADIFLGIAKLRAARLLVARMARACGAADAARELQLAATTSERMMARRDPWVNMLRVTSATAAAAIGGADEITVLPYTWALGQPDAQTSRIARNVGMVLREEAGLGRIADPAGGAFAVEHLTQELATKAWGIFQGWEARGGMLAALKSGIVQEQIAAMASARMKDVAHRRIELTGVSAYPQAASDGVVTKPWPLQPKPTPAPGFRTLPPHRLAEAFEALRDAADGATATDTGTTDTGTTDTGTTGTRPSVFLATLGPAAEHGARRTWIANLLATGGIGVITANNTTNTTGDGFTASGDAGLAFATSGAKVACICGNDETYELLGEATAMALKGAGASHVILAGRPGDAHAALMAAGIDQFIHAGIDVVAALTDLHRALGLEPAGG